MRFFGIVALCCAAFAFSCTRLESGEDTFGVSVGGSSTAAPGAAGLGGDDSPGGGSEGLAGTGGTAGVPSVGGEGPGTSCPPREQRPLEVLAASGELTLTTDTRWTCAADYLLEHSVFVASGATLTIDPGVTVKLRPKTLLLVERGARLEAVGTRQAPITLTSSKDPGERAAGDHRGLLLLGDGPSQSTTMAVYDSVAGARAHYGGGQAGDPSGSCGRLEFVRVEFGGGSIDDASLPAGALTLAGCGAGTVVDHIQIHRATDGLGLLGGNVGLRHVVVSGTTLGEAVEWSAGYTGTLQFVVAQTLGASAAMKGSNSADDAEASPASRPIIYNATLVGIYDDRTGRAPPITGQHYGFNLQLGSRAVFKNSLVIGFADAGFDWDLDEAAAGSLVGPGKAIDISHVLLFRNQAPYSSEAQVLGTMPSMRAQDPGLLSAADPTEDEPEATPSFAPTDPTVNIDPASAPPSFDATVGFRGAVPQDGADWTEGWTSYPAE